jgi:hypothetical protein
MSLGDVTSKGSTIYFVARSRSDPGIVRAYKDNKANRRLLLNTFKELSDLGGGVPLVVGDHVMYAHRGGIKRSRISCIVYGVVHDLSDRDYQLVDTNDGSVFNTTRDRIAPIP